MATEYRSQSLPGMRTRVLTRQAAGQTGASTDTIVSGGLHTDQEERSSVTQPLADILSANAGIKNLSLDGEPVISKDDRRIKTEN